MIKYKMREILIIVINKMTIIKMNYRKIKNNIIINLMKIKKQKKQFNLSRIKNNKGSLI